MILGTTGSSSSSSSSSSSRNSAGGITSTTRGDANDGSVRVCATVFAKSNVARCAEGVVSNVSLISGGTDSFTEPSILANN